MKTATRSGLVLMWIAVLGFTSPGPGASPQTDGKIEASGLHKVFRITDKLLSGSSPEGDAGFESLQKLGVKTILTVDGATPDVGRAHKFGMRYVHIPIGYDGVPMEAALRMARAVRDLPGLVYIHCHHGQHRGPASAAAVHLLLDPKCTVQTALAEMKRAGTDPKYTGLYAAPANIRRLGPVDLDKVDAGFPESVKPAAFAQVMVRIDEQWDKLKEIKAASWKPTHTEPNSTPGHQALLLNELWREAVRMPEIRARPPDFQSWLRRAVDASTKLETALACEAGKPGVDALAAEDAFKAVAASCTQCHAKYRDVPRR
jgi:protein tyrosine phosphatase (PTP) superfamily phosphohydrolase (DUF442 family)